MLFNNLIYSACTPPLNLEETSYVFGRISEGESFNIQLPNGPFVLCVMMLSGSVGKYRGTAGTIVVYRTEDTSSSSDIKIISNAIGTYNYYATSYISGDNLKITNTDNDVIYPTSHLFTFNK